MFQMESPSHTLCPGGGEDPPLVLRWENPGLSGKKEIPQPRKGKFSAGVRVADLMHYGFDALRGGGSTKTPG